MNNNSLPIDQEVPLRYLLKETRETQGLSLEGAAQHLRISKRHLRALEEENSLTHDVYTMGFFKSYANYLGLNGEELCRKLKDQSSPPANIEMSFSAPLPGKGRPSAKILLFAFLMVLGGIVGWQWLGSLDFPAVEAPVVPEEKAPQILLQAEPAPTPAEPTLSHLPEAVILKISEPAWIEVKDIDGNIVVSRLFNANEDYTFENPTGLLLKTGNAGGTQLLYGGKTLSLGEKKDVVKSQIPLDPEKWAVQPAGVE